MTSIGQESWYIFWVQLTLSLILGKTILFRQHKYFKWSVSIQLLKVLLLFKDKYSDFNQEMNIYHVTFDYIKEE